jgi:microcin C transport system ATP-binding protein
MHSTPERTTDTATAKPQQTAVLEYQDVHIGFRRQGLVHNVVHGASLAVHRNESVALVGESGSGKTVTGQAVMRLLPETTIAYPDGRILLDGKDTLQMSRMELQMMRGKEIGMVFQEPMASLNPLHKVKTQIMENVLLHKRTSQKAAEEVALEWLRRVGIQEPEAKLLNFPHQLSGGERQRVMIAMALANNPKVLVADEPTTALDVTIQAQILELIRRLQHELQMAVLFITHDLSIVRQVADRVAVMHDGHIVEVRPTAELFSDPQHPYTKSLLEAELNDAPPVPDGHQRTVVSMKDLRVWFPIQRGFLRLTKGYIKAVDGVTVSIKAGQSLGVVGESGSGKTTLGKALLKLTEPRGEVWFGETPLHELTSKQMRPFRRQLQVIFQDPFGSLSPRLNVEEIIGEGLIFHKIGTSEEREQMIIDAMEEVGLDPETRVRFPHEFSGGQRQRIALARALVLRPQVLVLDEPTSSLDRAIQFQIVQLLRRLQQDHGLTYLFISHDLKVVKSLCHDIIIMKEGKVVESGPASRIFYEPEHPYTKQLLETAFR